MSRRVFSYTLIKRGHLVSQFGVGAVIRTRQGLTAVVAGLPEWSFRLTQAMRSEAEANRYVAQHAFHEPELAAATGVQRFLPPPPLSDERFQWELPVIRFPLSGACSNWACRRISVADHGAKFARRWECGRCTGKSKGLVQQSHLFYACPAGHLDEIDWSGIITHKPGCAGTDIKANSSSRSDAGSATCISCGEHGMTQKRQCSGARPWVPGCAPDSCEHDMEVVSRSSVKAYFANTKSAIHIPLEADLNLELLDWLERTRWAIGRDLNTDPQRRAAGALLREAGWNLDEDEAIAHLLEAQRTDAPPDSDWDILDARSREYDVLSGRRQYPALETSPLISLEYHDLANFDHELIGSDRLITGVTSVHKLTESRVLNGFSRIMPRAITPREGRLMMWGADVPSTSWLPGYRTHGEGIFITLNPSKFADVGANADASSRELFTLSSAGTAAHTLAHLLINELAENSGYSAPSIRDRIYDLPSGDVGVMVYTAEGDAMGTLGGLVAFSQPGEFEALLSRALSAAEWCPQDPVCRETTLDHQRGIHAACHQCILVPETSCELFNARLDRTTVTALT